MDIALGGHLSGTESHYVRTLFEEHLVCIASRSHPQLADDRWDLARYLSLPHGLYAPADDGSTEDWSTVAWRKSAAGGASP